MCGHQAGGSPLSTVWVVSGKDMEIQPPTGVLSTFSYPKISSNFKPALTGLSSSCTMWLFFQHFSYGHNFKGHANHPPAPVSKE